MSEISQLDCFPSNLYLAALNVSVVMPVASAHFENEIMHLQGRERVLPPTPPPVVFYIITTAGRGDHSELLLSF